MDEQAVEFSIVIPVKNEEESLGELAREITAAMAATTWRWECVWVNDGSTDATQQALEALHRQQARHRWVCLERNYGQSAAMAAGFAQARGEFVGTLDGDGQNDPSDLPRLLEQLLRGDIDMVNGIRRRRQDSAVRRLSSRIGNGFRNWLTHEKVSDVGCSIRVFRRACVEGLVVFKGMHRFLPTLIRMRGFRITEVPVNHRPRSKGVTKYGIWNRLWVGIGDVLMVAWLQKRFVQARIRESV